MSTAESPDSFKLDMSNPIHVFSKKVAEDLEKSDCNDECGFIITISIILMIISITISLAKFVYDCLHAKDVGGRCISPGIFEKITVRRHVKKNMTREDFQLYGDKIVESIFKVAKTYPCDEIQKIYDKARLG